ncbi:hypothetical protein AM493_14425 [Flavobacterium akiainvivens]|uniref:Glycosyl transferase n=1 Tax=Flavobacterium akiainvivens TaxID=1202724 RepID=A0A0M8MK00_9FLAO|nr:glycosyltransferase [Flavobacterium akiainvivens]KOS07098.1 hypothetical protein AM493_14425 [Flavobacterium akiainvivens]SFQ75614.1 Glycosyltransferase involved in cell wall bisynthesis [Flavobacterium akiainvivens]
MKVLHIINDLRTGGAEKLVTEIVPMFNAKGITADVLLLNGSQTPFYKQLEDAGCTIFSLTNGSTYNMLLSFKIIPYLKKYDVVHVHLFPSQYWVAVAKMVSFSTTKLVYTEHSTSSRRTRKPIFRLLDSLFYKPYKKIVCISETVVRSVKNHITLPEHKFALVSNGVDIKKYAQADGLNPKQFFEDADSNTKILIQVASFVPVKDQPTVIRALTLLPDNVKLLLAGDGLCKQDCIALVKELGLENRVKFLGIRMDVPQLLKTAHILVMSTQYEGFSLASVEGMAAHLPVIASNVPPLETIVGGAGLLFPYKDHKALAAQVEILLNNEALYAQTAQNCAARATQYGIDVMIDKHIELYKTLM